MLTDAAVVVKRTPLTVTLPLPPFTLVGATTRSGLLTTPLRDRFGIPIRLNFYTVAELEQVVRRAAGLLNAPLTQDGAHEVARRSRGTPRIAGRLLRRVRDFAQVRAGGGEPQEAVHGEEAAVGEVEDVERGHLQPIHDVQSDGSARSAAPGSRARRCSRACGS